MGIGLLPHLEMSPVQIALALLVTGSLSLAVLVLGMTTTLVRSPRGERRRDPVGHWPTDSFDEGSGLPVSTPR